jgi:hypothetical protein
MATTATRRVRIKMVDVVFFSTREAHQGNKGAMEIASQESGPNAGKYDKILK